MTEGYQMTIWDYFRELESLDNLPENEMVHRIEGKTGLRFSFKENVKWSELNYYEAKDKGVEYLLHYDTYMNTSVRFIAVGWNYKTSGGGAPCDSVDEAVEKLKAYMFHASKEKERRKAG